MMSRRSTATGISKYLFLLLKQQENAGIFDPGVYVYVDPVDSTVGLDVCKVRCSAERCRWTPAIDANANDQSWKSEAATRNAIEFDGSKSCDLSTNWIEKSKLLEECRKP
ncbi:hypothetical protein TWF481_004265 [Arthrobotrys musiformis]|uniref:Uncharacterized protein n=1 Tax=Arthrobotrys musiformis TaxID=47236 RepID=A0AAV9WJH8_9PEZI